MDDSMCRGSYRSVRGNDDKRRRRLPTMVTLRPTAETISSPNQVVCSWGDWTSSFAIRSELVIAFKGLIGTTPPMEPW
jgi:hypothetical protein